MGWGLTKGTSYPSVLQQRSVTVLAVGPMPRVAFDAGAADAVPPGFFTTGEAMCQGDSGSPAIAGSGAVVGVASAVSRSDLVAPDGTAADCKGAWVRGLYQATSAEKSTIISGFVAAKAKPWLEGAPDPRAGLKDFAASCTVDSECKSNACVLGPDGVRRCTHGCLSSDCPEGYGCSQVNSRWRCVLTSPPAPPPDPPREGCAMATPAGSVGWMLLVLSLLVLPRIWPKAP
jgi:hypothetical protein